MCSPSPGPASPPRRVVAQGPPTALVNRPPTEGRRQRAPCHTPGQSPMSFCDISEHFGSLIFHEIKRRLVWFPRTAIAKGRGCEGRGLGPLSWASGGKVTRPPAADAGTVPRLELSRPAWAPSCRRPVVGSPPSEADAAPPGEGERLRAGSAIWKTRFEVESRL